MAVQRSTPPADAPVFSPRQVISEELFVRLVYLWLRDASLDMTRAFDRSHVEDQVALLFGSEPIAFGSSARLADARALLRLAPPGVVL